MTAADFASLLRARRIGRGRWVAKCPAHPDKRPSLSIAVGKKTDLVFKCMSHGCTQDEVLAAMGLTWRDVLGEREVDPQVLRRMRLEEQRRIALRQWRTELLWLAKKRIEFWDRKTRVLGRSLMKWPSDKLAREFHHALAMERMCRRIFETL